MADFEHLFSENYDFIYKYLTKLCKDPTLAEELTQETFFRAYMNLGKLHNQERIAAWLCQIAKNSFYTWYRESQKYGPLDENAASSPISPLWRSVRFSVKAKVGQESPSSAPSKN